MVFKLVKGAQKNWRRLDGHALLPKTHPGGEVHQRAGGHRQGEQPSDRSRRRQTDQSFTNFWR
jgi:hypothetical protein